MSTLLAAVVFIGLLSEIEKVFGNGAAHASFPFQDAAAVARLQQWDMPCDSVKAARDFAAEMKNARLASQVEFLFALHAVMKPFADVLAWWSKFELMSDPHAKMEGQWATSDSVGLLKALRVQYATFSKTGVPEARCLRSVELLNRRLQIPCLLNFDKSGYRTSRWPQT